MPEVVCDNCGKHLPIMEEAGYVRCFSCDYIVPRNGESFYSDIRGSHHQYRTLRKEFKSPVTSESPDNDSNNKEDKPDS